MISPALTRARSLMEWLGASGDRAYRKVRIDCTELLRQLLRECHRQRPFSCSLCPLPLPAIIIRDVEVWACAECGN